MSQHLNEVETTIHAIADEQVLFLKNRYKMNAEEIINLYTGKRDKNATYGDAIQSIIAFNSQNAARQGFVAC